MIPAVLRPTWRTPLLLAILAVASLVVHGYHPGAEDDAIYLAAIKKHLDPSLYPFHSGFFSQQTRFTLCDELAALCVRFSHLPVHWVTLFLHVLSIFGILSGCMALSRRCFREPDAHWASVLTIFSLLALPVAGTALHIADCHFHPRSPATAAILFALTQVLGRRFILAGLLLAFAFAMHPLMAVFGTALTVFLACGGSGIQWRGMGKASLSAGVVMSPDGSIWGEIRRTRRHHYLLQWTWYEQVGILAPIGLLFAFGAFPMGNALPALPRLARSTAWFGSFSTLAALTVSLSEELGTLGPFQPMRSLHLVYVILFLLLGGFVGRAILKGSPWRWVLFFFPLCLTMFLSQRVVFSGSDHLLLPWTSPRNPWVEAFQWVRLNTPPDALFALNPRYMKHPGQDFHGFRALAERSALADAVKDPGVVAESFAAESVRGVDPERAPSIARDWHEQTVALKNWKDFTGADFQQLNDRFGVTWVVLDGADAKGLECHYRNAAVSVCRIPDP